MFIASFILLFYFILFLLFVHWRFACIYVCTPLACLVLEEVRREHQILLTVIQQNTHYFRKYGLGYSSVSEVLALQV